MVRSERREARGGLPNPAQSSAYEHMHMGREKIQSWNSALAAACPTPPTGSVLGAGGRVYSSES